MTVVSLGGGKSQIVFRQLRDVFTTMLQPMKSGLDLSKGLGSAFEQLAAQGQEVWAAVYGNESITAILELLKHTETYNRELEFMNALGREQRDIAKEIYENRAKSPRTQAADVFEKTEALKKEMALDMMSARQAMAETGALKNLSPVGRSLPLLPWLVKMGARLGATWGTSDSVISAHVEMAKAEKKAGTQAITAARANTILNESERYLAAVALRQDEIRQQAEDIAAIRKFSDNFMSVFRLFADQVRLGPSTHGGGSSW